MNAEHNLIVIGSGLAGLSSAFMALKRGLTVLLLESGCRIGGQVLTASMDDDGSSLNLGAEVIDITQHYAAVNEINKRRLVVSKITKFKEFYVFEDKSTLNENLLRQLVDHKLYIESLRIMNGHSRRLTFNNGYAQRDFMYLDVSLIEYVDNTLKLNYDHSDSTVNTTIEYKIRELLLLQLYQVSGGADPALVSALGVLYIIAGFGSVETAFSHFTSISQNDLSQSDTNKPNGFHTIDGGMGRLTASMASEIESLGGQIRLNCAVIGITKIHTADNSTTSTVTEDSVSVPNYDYPTCKKTKPLIQLKLATGELLLTKAIIVAVPLRCIPSIVFKPPLPMCLQQAGERCNIGVQYMKVFGRATGVSNRVERVLSFAQRGKDVQRIAISSEDVAPSHIVNGRRGSVVFSYKEESDGDDSGDDSNTNLGCNTLVRITGYIRDLLGDEKDFNAVLRESHPVAQFVPSRHHSGSADIRKGTHDNVLYHDFPSDPWSRGSWFALKAGTASLHADASHAARNPWSDSDAATLKLSSSQSQQRSNKSEEEDDTAGPLIIACSDLYPEWTGWMEGAIRAGQDATRRIYPYLEPPKIERNFFRRVQNVKK